MDASSPEAREHLMWRYRNVSVRCRLKPHISIAKSVYVYIRTGVATVLGFRTYLYYTYESTKGLSCNMKFLVRS